MNDRPEEVTLGSSVYAATASPLILTAAFDREAAETFQQQRDLYFPAALNMVPAHLTLFHKLPGAELKLIDQALRPICAEHSAIPFQSAGLQYLGRGVAIKIETLALMHLRDRLARSWHDWLSAQDRQRFRPHVTIQNKVASRTARGLMAQLEVEGLSVSGTVIGLDLWWYRNGPWERVNRHLFRQQTAL